eukprot:CAMPEP_0113626574 /NCGR_PEP_ID=MMETSP0017_2-20120614/13745_1 /TAXON_ID=2856 /ORGANISM="Cylindrotheca closterium" /LENGTH=66 /DNA_ID=CAMNT_0000536763 /DNA_START=128 /DNA_END=325 /DNA_ORIENTATION=+ /assembly_acc=CAM_ASM_000147
MNGSNAKLRYKHREQKQRPWEMKEFVMPLRSFEAEVETMQALVRSPRCRRSVSARSLIPRVHHRRP